MSIPTMQDCHLKDELDAALKRYNALFAPGSRERLALIPLQDFESSPGFRAWQIATEPHQ